MQLTVTIRSAHADDTRCTHPLTPGGRSRTRSCTGRAYWTAVCSHCPGRIVRSADHTALEVSARLHLDSHAAGTAEQTGPRSIADVHLPEPTAPTTAQGV